MIWQNSIQLAENTLSSGAVPPSEEIISLIKRVNPTNLNLSDPDRQRGYEVKGRLQNLLLENYGDGFHLVTLPYDNDIVLIKHRHLPSVDACHANLNRLSPRALTSVGEGAAQSKPGVKNKPKKPGKVADDLDPATPGEVVKKAELLLEDYDYEGARGTLAGIMVSDPGDLPALMRAANMLIDEIGSFESAIDTLCAQPKHLVKDKSVRETLALAYYKNSMIPEARAIFELIHSNDLGKEALYTYASISNLDGNCQQAYALLKMADARDGFVTAFPGLRADVERAMQEEALPIFEEAKNAFDRNDLARSLDLAKQALACFPKYREAGELVAILEAIGRETQAKGLWDRLGKAGEAQERLALLEQLLEKDGDNEARIRNLIVEEKSAIREQVLKDKIEGIRAAASDQKWADLFDDATWVLANGDQNKAAAVFSFSPYISLLKPTKQLQRFSQHKVKNGWLDFIEVEQEIRRGKPLGHLPSLVELKSLFSGCDLFNSVYREVYEAEQENAKASVCGLVTQMHSEGCSASHAEQLAVAVRRHLPMIAKEERGQILQAVSARLEQLKPRTPEEVLLEEYREAFKIGNDLKCAAIKVRVHDHRKIEEIERDHDLEYRIEAEPMKVTIDESLAVDIESDTVSFKVIGRTNDAIIIDNLSGQIILLRPKEKKATRYKAKFFSNLKLCDYLDETNEYLFKKEKEDLFLRVELTEESARTKAVITNNTHLDYDEYLSDLFMASDRCSDYFCGGVSECTDDNGDVIVELIRRDVFKKRTADKFRCKIPDCGFDLYRVSHSPDRFSASINGNIYVLDRNMAVIAQDENCGEIVGTDIKGGLIYMLWGGKIVSINHKTNYIGDYEIGGDGDTGPIILGYEVIGISTEFRSLLIKNSLSDNDIYIYNFNERKWTNYFSASSLINTATDSRFYVCKLDEAKITLRDVTDTLDSVLDWPNKCTNKDSSQTQEENQG